MNVNEILDKLNQGQVVSILATDAFEFMREVERHSLTSHVIRMTVANGMCVMRLDRVDQPRVDQ